MPATALPPATLRAAGTTPTGTPTATILARLAAYESSGRDTEPQRRTQYTGIAAKGR
jgi:hypothetical protein